MTLLFKYLYIAALDIILEVKYSATNIRYKESIQQF